MKHENNIIKAERIKIDDLLPQYLSLKIGETIPRLEIKQIRKVINHTRDNNLPGVDYKYFIESKDKKLLTVNSWVLWNAIAKVLREAGTLEVTLFLEHSAREQYTIKRI